MRTADIKVGTVYAALSSKHKEAQRVVVLDTTGRYAMRQRPGWKLGVEEVLGAALSRGQRKILVAVLPTAARPLSIAAADAVKGERFGGLVSRYDFLLPGEVNAEWDEYLIQKAVHDEAQERRNAERQRREETLDRDAAGLRARATALGIEVNIPKAMYVLSSHSPKATLSMAALGELLELAEKGKES